MKSFEVIEMIAELIEMIGKTFELYCLMKRKDEHRIRVLSFQM